MEPIRTLFDVRALICLVISHMSCYDLPMPFDPTDLIASLGRHKVLTDKPARIAYSIDAGIYAFMPLAVVLVESASDMEAVLSYAKAHRLSLTARGGGTNVSGNAIGEGIVVDFSRLNRVIDINSTERRARVQPGMIYAELNRHLAKQGWMFAPDPSSGDICKLGGMLGNNAAGPHTLKYGTTKDNVHGMEVLLTSGRWITAKTYDLDDASFHQMLREHPSVEALVRLIRRNQTLLLEKKRHVAKNSSGYNLFALAEGLVNGKFPLHQLFIGSEGTLGLIGEAELSLTPRPHQTAACLIYLRQLSDIGAVVRSLRDYAPSALEMMDAGTLNLIGRGPFDIPNDAAAMLLVEFDDAPQLKMEAAVAGVSRFSLSTPVVVAFDPVQQAAFWKIRRAIFPALYRYDVHKKPIHFVDDVVVPSERIAELIPYLDATFRSRGVTVAIYGHVGDGNAHINPLLNLHDSEDFAKMRDLADEIHTAVIDQFGGSLCGEHGDGRVRAEFLPYLYGPEVYTLFKEVKALFDPEGLLNPGVKISTTPFTENIDFARLSKLCATCGKCNAVCPVYDVTQEESSGARGWFHIVTASDYTYDAASRVVEACINCKSCASACPVGIDVSALILKKREAHPNRVAETVFALQERQGLFERVLRAAAWTQPLWDTYLGRKMIEYATLPWLKHLAPTARIPADMILPKLARRTLRQRHADLTYRKTPTAYFHGCAANYFDDGVGDAVLSFLDKQGIAASLPPQRCSGVPIQTYGLAQRVRDNARFNLEALSGFDRVVTGCASCTLMLKSYATVLPDAQVAAAKLAEKVFHISEMAAEGGHPQILKDKKGKRRVTYHSSCHLRQAGVHEAPRRILRGLPELEYVEMPDADRCAGGAGTFCIKNPAQSSEIFERKRRGIEEAKADVVATSCPACVIQLRNGLKTSERRIEVVHIAQLMDQ